MTGKEYLWAYCQLKLHGYSYDEAQEIIEKVKTEMIKQTIDENKEALEKLADS